MGDLGQVEEAGAARRDHVRRSALLGSQRQVAPDQGVGGVLVDRDVLGGAAAVPVVDLLQRQAERRGDGLGREIVRLRRMGQGTTGVVGVAHHSASWDLASSRMARSWPIALMRSGLSDMRSLLNMSSAIGPAPTLRSGGGGK